MHTRLYLEKLFFENYSYSSLINVSFDELKNYLLSKIGSINNIADSYVDRTKQRDLSIKFHWGHNHNFGNDFELNGSMQNRHINVLSDFVDQFGLSLNLSGKKVLDIGVWTGGTSLLLAAMGADVVAIEEVKKYAETVNYLAHAFGIEKKLVCHSLSLYEFLPQIHDEFDIVIYPGVVYHVTDPLLSLRLIFSALKDSGRVFIESHGNASQESICYYEGPSIFHGGKQEELDRRGWNYFIPSRSCLQQWFSDAGFQETQIGPLVNFRLKGVATRHYFQDFCRAGISMAACR